MSENTGFDDPKHGGARAGFPEGIKDGTQEHRILPSMDGSGKYVRDHTCHYGYGTKMNNSDKEFPNPFYCVEEGKFVAGKFVALVTCPECEAIKKVKAEKEAIEADMKRARKSDEEIAQAVASHAKWLNKHNRDFKFYVNVKSADGRFFTVKYPSKSVWKPIVALIEEYKNRRIPIDAVAASQGLWFRLVKSGKGFKTEYAPPVVVTEDVIQNGQIIEGATKPKLAPLTPEDYKKAKESCLDLKDVGIRRLSREQVERLVASKGDPNVIQAVFAGSDDAKQTSSHHEEDETSPDTTPVEPPARPAAPPPETAPVTAPPAGETPEALMARARALVEQAKNLSRPAAPPPAAPPTPPPAAAAPTPPAPTPAAPPPPAPAPSAAPPASGGSAEDDFLSQFKL